MAFEGAGKVAGLEIWRIEVIFTLLHIFYLAKLDSTEKGDISLIISVPELNLSQFNFPISYCICIKNTSLAFWLHF
jgi:hypothetical protein